MAGADHQITELELGLLRVRAGNPSRMTHTGTNSYVLGDGAVTVIDPGPDDAAHMAALVSAIAGRDVAQIVVTHSHLDHSPLARRLSDQVKAPVVAFGDSSAGQSALMQELAAAGFAGGGEGIDRGFQPDQTVADGAEIGGGLRILHTPGHMGNHICLVWRDRIFTGDLVMGWASSLVSPPDGDLTDFMASCRRLRGEKAAVFHAGHGEPVTAPHARLDWLIDHREARSAQIEAALQAGPQSVADLTAEVYRDVPPQMHPMAARNLFAHLVDLVGRDRVQAVNGLRHDGRFRLR